MRPFLAGCLLIISMSIYAQQNKPVIISGKITGEAYAVKIYFFDTYYSIADVSHRLDTTIRLNNKGYFTCYLPSEKIGKIGQFVILYDEGELQDNDIVSDLVTEPGDSIFLDISTNNHKLDGIEISGRGAAKYQLITSLFFEKRSFNESHKYQGNKAADEDKYTMYEYLYKKIIADKLNFIKGQSEIIKKNKSMITEPVYEIILTDFEGDEYDDIEKYISTFLTIELSDPDTIKTERIIKFISASRIKLLELTDSATCLSPLYISYVYDRTINNLSMDKRVGADKIQSSFGLVYDWIENNYDGVLRERLLTELLVDPFKNAALLAMGNKKDKFITDALSVIHNAGLRNVIENSAVSRVGFGKPAFDFELPDTSGKLVKLRDMSGDVVLMDMWFTGCTGCVIFNTNTEAIIRQHFASNPHFKIVSICTDYDRKKWMHSLYSLKYSDPDNINLNAMQPDNNPMSLFKIPLIKYYGINYMPFVLLIDKDGKIVSQLSNNENITDVISAIENELSKK